MAPDWVDRAIIRPISAPIRENGGLVALFGNLAPRGAIMKRSAADPSLFEREGRAVVFDSVEDLAARIDDPALDVEADDFLVLKNAGPTSAAAMPEAGYLPIPAKLAKAGVKDMVRISDARMSGTAYGTIVLHVAPDAASGGPLGARRATAIAFASASKTAVWSSWSNSLSSTAAGPQRRQAYRTHPRAGVLEAVSASRSSRPTKVAISGS